ncbi:lipocalin family protein [Bacteroides congonensis]|uniref:lipocalin family protein n=1 Tax=Bacteroides congonensis TaxID=1871006 RepID=UPI003A865597
MGNVIKILSSVLLGCVCLLACSDNDEQNKAEVQKALLVGFWKAQSAQGNDAGEYNVCYDIRHDGTFTVYDYDTETGWYDDGEGEWKYENGSLTLDYTDQLDVFEVKSVTENTLILVDSSGDESVIVTYQRTVVQDIIVVRPKLSPVGVWACYKCVVVDKKCDDFPEIYEGKTWESEEGGIIILNSDHTGTWSLDGEQASFTWRFDADAQIIYAILQGQQEMRMTATYSNSEFSMPVNDWACEDHITDVYWRYYKRIS